MYQLVRTCLLLTVALAAAAQEPARTPLPLPSPVQDKNFYVLDLKTGKKLWEFKAGRAISAGAAIANGAIVLGDEAGNVYCLEPKK